MKLFIWAHALQECRDTYITNVRHYKVVTYIFVVFADFMFTVIPLFIHNVNFFMKLFAEFLKGMFRYISKISNLLLSMKSHICLTWSSSSDKPDSCRGGNFSFR